MTTASGFTCKIQRSRPRLERLTGCILTCRRCGVEKDSAEFRSPKLDGVTNCADCRSTVREEGKVKRQERYRRIKRLAIEAYGGRCWGCDEAREEFLVLERVFGRRNHKVYSEDERQASMRNLLYLLKERGFPQDRYRMSCSGCKGKFRNERPRPMPTLPGESDVRSSGPDHGILRGA